MRDLGRLGGSQSDGMGINANGQVVGWYATPAGAGHAFLYTNGHAFDLNKLISATEAKIYTLTDATGINDSGQIVANGYLNGVANIPRALLLTPRAP